MIDERRAYSYCCDDISQIENYDMAVADKDNTWHCHHRIEEIMNCGKRELISKGAYYNRPARELIFLSQQEHLRIHHKGVPSGMSGKHQPESARKAISKKLTGRVLSDEHKMKLKPERGGLATKGMRWFTDGKKNTRAFTCPDGFWLGRS